jgi:Holliday junction resolvasome RuvABC ATP-dependent DNA helicase subunit
VRDYAQVKADGVVSKDGRRCALKMLDVDALGST